MITCTYCGKRIINGECPDRTCEWHAVQAQARSANDELERLLAEEEEIERRDQMQREIKRLQDLVDELQTRDEERLEAHDDALEASWENGRIQGRQEAFTFVNRLCDLFKANEMSDGAAFAAIKAAVHAEVW